MTNRRYGANKYGDGKLYGATDSYDTLLWDVSVDWDDDGFYDGNEASRLVGLSTSRGRTKMIKPNGQGFESVRTGSASVTLLNFDGRYDAWNSASSLYPNVTYGKRIRIRVRDASQAGTVIYPVFTGRITNINAGGYGKDARVVLQANDGMEYLRNTNSRVTSLQTSITPDAAIGRVLDSAMFYTQGGKNLDVSTDLIDYWWSDGNALAMSEIESIATSFLGYFFIGQSGDARFVKRTSVTSPVYEYDQSILLQDIDNPQPYEIRRNITRVKAHPRTLSSTVVLWQLLGNVPSISPGAANALTLFANYTYSNRSVPGSSMVTPVATTDYTMNTQSDGLGTDKTGNCTVAFTDFGNTAKLVITNNDASTVYLTKMQIRGSAVYEANSADVTYPTDVSTVTNPRELIFDLQWEQDVNVAVDLTVVLGPFFAQLHPTPSIKIESRPAAQFTPELFDIVVVSIPAIGLTGRSYRVGGIEHSSIIDTCQAVRTRLYLEPYVTADDYMQWDTHSLWDTETVFGW